MSKLSKVLIDNVLIDEDRMILCKEGSFSNLSELYRQSLIRTIFPILTKTTLWGFFKKIKYTVEPCYKRCRSQFDSKNKEFESGHDWGKYPFVVFFFYKKNDDYHCRVTRISDDTGIFKN